MLHQTLDPRAYLEIGTESGASLGFARCCSVAIDPQFRLEGNVTAGKPALHLIQQTSDDAFASGVVDRLGYRFDLAFLDGLHLIEFLLRDFIATEKVMTRDGLIVVHDCVPTNAIMAERTWNRRQTKQWAGDVWKLVPILRKYRPDLKVEVLDFAPTGLVEISNLDPENAILSQKYDEILKDFRYLSLSEYGMERWKSTLDLKARAPARVETRNRSANIDECEFVVQTPTPRPRNQDLWGDTHYARGLVSALRRKGYRARFQTRKFWHESGSSNEIDIVVRGDHPHPSRSSLLTVYWLLYFKDRDGLVEELRQADHVFVSGPGMQQDIRADLFDGPDVSLLPQAFDLDVSECPEPTARNGIVFAGLNRRGGRAIVRHALEAGERLEIYGRHWDRDGLSGSVVAEHINPAELSKRYRTAEVVLNDHRPEMRDGGSLSNRVFDALAAGAPVISDPVTWMPDEFRPFVHIVDSPDDMKKALAAIRAETPEFRQRRVRLAEEMRQKHSFDQRAEDIIRVVKQALEKKQLEGAQPWSN